MQAQLEGRGRTKTWFVLLGRSLGPQAEVQDAPQKEKGLIILSLQIQGGPRKIYLIV